MIHFFADFAVKLADWVRRGSPKPPLLLMAAGDGGGIAGARTATGIAAVPRRADGRRRLVAAYDRRGMARASRSISPRRSHGRTASSLTARAAIAITGPGQTKPLLGTIELTLATRIDEAPGVVHLSNPKLLATHFPSLDTQQAAALEAKIRAALPQMDTRRCRWRRCC